EGGEYLSEFNEYDCIKIDKIIEDELRSQSPYFYDDPFALGTYPNSIYEKTIQRIEKRILTELKTYTKTDDSYMGF
ncbi:MAG TPA: hypothetical protein VN451_09985, partial [Chitinophagaceae bacterium]|nr:hypothetical protein [Chitinophagaceae bacterium]